MLLYSKEGNMTSLTGETIDPSWWRNVAREVEGRQLVILGLHLREAISNAKTEIEAQSLEVLAVATACMLEPDNWNTPLSLIHI